MNIKPYYSFPLLRSPHDLLLKAILQSLTICNIVDAGKEHCPNYFVYSAIQACKSSTICDRATLRAVFCRCLKRPVTYIFAEFFRNAVNYRLNMTL